MTSLLSKLLGRFRNQIRREDLFTEAVARLFERDPRLCLEWLRNEGLISPGFAGTDGWRMHVQTQKPLVVTNTLASPGIADMFIEVRRASRPRDAEVGVAAEAVMIESKIGSWEGKGQLRKYAEYLQGEAVCNLPIVPLPGRGSVWRLRRLGR